MAGLWRDGRNRQAAAAAAAAAAVNKCGGAAACQLPELFYSRSAMASENAPPMLCRGKVVSGSREAGGLRLRNRPGPAPLASCPPHAVLDRAQYVELRQELAELKAAAAAARGGGRVRSTPVPTSCWKVLGRRLRACFRAPGQGHAFAVDVSHPSLPPPPPSQLESALVRAAREECAAREAQLQGELAAAQAAARDQLEKAARQRRQHERCGS